jgi:uncharacterized protein YggT (Ycf19 family)
VKAGRGRILLQVARGVAYFAYAVLAVYVVILSTAFILQLLGANPEAGFAQWIYDATERIMEPFRGLFPTTEISDRAVFDGSLLFAIIVYSLLGVGVGVIVDALGRRLDRLRLQEEQERYLAAVAAGSALPADAQPGPYGVPQPGPPGAGTVAAGSVAPAAAWPTAPPTAPPSPPPAR